WLHSTATSPLGGPAHPPLSVEYRPRVEVWTDRADSPYTSGQGVRTHFRGDRDAFVTILRVDTDGRVRVLFPREPWEDNFARGGREYEVQGGNDRDAFYIDDYPGVGYLFAVASADPFVYDGIQSKDHWDYRLIADGRVPAIRTSPLPTWHNASCPTATVIGITTSRRTTWNSTTTIPGSCATTATRTSATRPGARTTTPACAFGSWSSMIRTTNRIATTASRGSSSRVRTGRSPGSSSRTARRRMPSLRGCASGP